MLRHLKDDRLVFLFVQSLLIKESVDVSVGTELTLLNQEIQTDRGMSNCAEKLTSTADDLKESCSTDAIMVEVIASDVAPVHHEALISGTEECGSHSRLDVKAVNPFSVNCSGVQSDCRSSHDVNQTKDSIWSCLPDNKNTEIMPSERLTSHSELVVDNYSLLNLVMPLENPTNPSLADGCGGNASQTTCDLNIISDYGGASELRDVTTTRITFQAEADSITINNLPAAADRMEISSALLGFLNEPSMREMNNMQTKKNGETIDLPTPAMPQSESEINAKNALPEYLPLLSGIQNVDLGLHTDANMDSTRGCSQTNNALAITESQSCFTFHEVVTKLGHVALQDGSKLTIPQRAVGYDVPEFSTAISVSPHCSSGTSPLPRASTTAEHETGSSRIETFQQQISPLNVSANSLLSGMQSRPESVMLKETVGILTGECLVGEGQFMTTDSSVGDRAKSKSKDLQSSDVSSYQFDNRITQLQQLNNNVENVCTDFRKEEHVTLANHCMSRNNCYTSISHDFFQPGKGQAVQASNDCHLLSSLNDESQSLSSSDATDSNLHHSQIVSAESSVLDSISCKCADIGKQACFRQPDLSTQNCSSSASRPRTKRPLFSCKGPLMPCHMDQISESGLPPNEASTYKAEALPAMLQGMMIVYQVIFLLTYCRFTFIISS